MTSQVSDILGNWYKINQRDLPWRKTDNPYLIWLSEVIMQQTRVSQGLEYYNRFVLRYPQIEDLARAPIDEVLKLWQGLGYYTRARNLHLTAKNIVDNYGGRFPETFEELLKLKGIGEYTAAAIASMAFRKPVSLLDGNVYRVISRLFGIRIPVESPAGREIFRRHARELLNIEDPGMHNQALMEFGALVCLPLVPKCPQCVLAEYCEAFRLGIAARLPVKKEKISSRIRYLNYVFVLFRGSTWLKKRNGRDIWNSLYEFPLVETSLATESTEILQSPEIQSVFAGLTPVTLKHTALYTHKLTHQTLICRFLFVVPDTEIVAHGPGFIRVSMEKLHEYAVPRAIDRYIKDLTREGQL